MIFPEKNNQIYIIFYLQTINLIQKSEIFRNFPEIADDHNSGTEYARDIKFVSICVVLDTLLYSTNNSISTKSGFRPFWKWALHMRVVSKYGKKKNWLVKEKWYLD